MQVRRLPSLVALLLLAGGIAAFLPPSRQSGRDAVPAEDDDARRILRDLAAWDGATHDERRAAAAWVAARTDGFAFDGTETFGFGRHRHQIAVFEHEATGLEFSLVPGGTFLMGSPEDEADRCEWEGPPHLVTIPTAFLLCRTEATQAAWERVMGSNPSYTKRDDHPVEQVSWDDVQRFCAKSGLRFPSESEWEYACRAGTTTRFWSGDTSSDLEHAAWFDGDPGIWSRLFRGAFGRLGIDPPEAGHHPVAAKSANALGLHDIHGNVWEWCEDTWHPDYDGAPTDGSARVDPIGRYRVRRGGGWLYSAAYARSALRYWLVPSFRSGNVGFRPAASVAQ